MVLSPKDSGDFIVKHSKFVSISDDGIQNLVDEVNIFKSFLQCNSYTSFFNSFQGCQGLKIKSN